MHWAAFVRPGVCFYLSKLFCWKKRKMPAFYLYLPLTGISCSIFPMRSIVHFLNCLWYCKQGQLASSLLSWNRNLIRSKYSIFREVWKAFLPYLNARNLSHWTKIWPTKHNLFCTLMRERPRYFEFPSMIPNLKTGFFSKQHKSFNNFQWLIWKFVQIPSAKWSLLFAKKECFSMHDQLQNY